MNEPGNNAIRRCWNMEGVVKISSAVQQWISGVIHHPKMGDTEWSNGVIFPFVDKGFAPSLNCKVRMEMDHWDIFLTTGDEYVIHIEHENVVKDLNGEFEKMKNSPPKPKCGISYGKRHEIDEKLKEICQYVSRYWDEIKFHEEWMFIFDVYGSDGFLRNAHNWEAYRINNKRAKKLSFGIHEYASELTQKK